MKTHKGRAAGKVDQGSKLSVIQSDVAGIDIGSREMFVCGPADQQGRRELRVFATTTQQIQECVGWLKQQKVRSVAMESTGVYWIPVLEIMESGGLEVLLVDTRPLSRVPGRKTDVEDCQWLQTLHSHGLLRGAYRPSEQISELRTIVPPKGSPGAAAVGLDSPDAQVSGSDERASSPRGEGHQRSNRDGDATSDCGRRERSSEFSQTTRSGVPKE